MMPSAAPYCRITVLCALLLAICYVYGCMQTTQNVTGNTKPSAATDTGNAKAPGGNTNVTERDDSTPSRQQRPSFADAMQSLKPLGKVAGSRRAPLPVSDDAGNRSPSVDFSEAVNYARQLESYSLLIWHNGELLLERYFNGFAAELRPNTASMHKSVMALLIAAAIDDGFIESVDTPVADYLEQWRGRPEGDITIEQLLHMSSGLKPLSLEGGADSPRAKFVAQHNAMHDSRDRETTIREILMNMRLEAVPGSRFLYTNTNSQILCMVIEAATQKPYADYLSERLWRSIGADDAYVWNYGATGFPRTYTTLMATALDWLRIGLLIKDRGYMAGNQLISAALVDAMTAPSPANINYGWQIWLGNQYVAERFYNDAKTGPSFAAKQPFAVDDMIYLDGIGGQRVYISRNKDLVIVRTGELRMDWDDSHLPNLVLAALAD